jgi:DNA-binding LacI/PurR family transcriptional regulator
LRKQSDRPKLPERNSRPSEDERPKRKKIILQDVAWAAHVSVSTVSRVVTGGTRVNPEIAERVKVAALELGIDLHRRDKTKVMGFLLSNREMLHPFHSRLLSGVEAYCATHDYNLLFHSFRYGANVPWKELHVPQILRRRDLAGGFIIAGANSQNLLDWLIRESIHFAILGNNVQGEWRPEKCDVVWFDDQLGAYELTRHLLTLGHRHIWFVGNCQLPWFSRRYEGYRRAMAEASLSPHLSEVDAEKDFEVGYLGTKSIFGRNEVASAILAGGDPTAQGVYKALLDCGFKIPEDMSVAGFDDIEAALLNPPLTTVQAFPEQVGKRLAQMLLDRLNRPDLPPQHSVIPTQLVKRESCRPLLPTQKVLGMNSTAIRTP